MFTSEHTKPLIIRSCKLLACACSLLMAPSFDVAAAELPRVLLQVRPQTIIRTGMVHIVSSGSDLQGTLNDAKPGDEIVLEAGTIYTGNFILKHKTGGGWITLRSSALDCLPPGERVRPEQAKFMPKLVSPNDKPVLSTDPGAAYYQVLGIEMTHAEEISYSHGLVSLGGEQSALDQVPHHLIFDRVYVHGHARKALKRGVALNSASTVIANSWVAECHVAGQDAQAIGGWNGPGPYKIYNNYLEGSGENLMFGGADPRVPELVPSDIEIRGNYLFKPLTWRKGKPGFVEPAWTVKNLLELKNARRVLIEGNVLENSWVHGQVGFAVLLTPRNQGGTAPWCVVEDVTFVNNIVRHCSSGVSILAEDDNHRSERASRLSFRNNLFCDINPGRFGGDGRLVQILSPRSPVGELAFERNTLLHGGRGNTFICFGGEPPVIERLLFRNNVVTRGEYGIHGSRGMGQKGLEIYCRTFELSGNLIIGVGSERGMPENNSFAPDLERAGFKDLAVGDYRLSPPWPSEVSARTGADLDALTEATAGAVSGVWN